MTCDSERERRTQIISMLFGAYGQGGDENRIAIYSKILESIPTEVLSKTVKKLVLESKFLPAISEVVEAAESLIGSVDDSRRIKEWGEAWGEIDRALMRTSWDESPTFSTPEITEAVKSYGWRTLQSSLAEQMPTVRAQMRRIYEDICKRSVEQRRNNYVLGESGTLLIGNVKIKQIGV